MDEYISKQRAKDLVGCCLASAKAEYKAAKDEFTKARFEDYMMAMRSMIDVVGSVEAADVQPVDRWISVNERLPEIGKSVLIYYPKWDGDEIQVAKLESDRMMFDICGEFNIGTGVVTHWMPLPEPPKDGDTNG